MSTPKREARWLVHAQRSAQRAVHFVERVLLGLWARRAHALRRVQRGFV
jgi:hypothetical protein